MQTHAIKAAGYMGENGLEAHHTYTINYMLWKTETVVQYTSTQLNDLE